MNTLKELIEVGEYELAAYRLVYGVLRTQVREPSPRTCSHSLSSTVHKSGEEKVKESDNDVRA